MRKTIWITFFSLTLVVAAQAQEPKDELVWVKGKLLKASDSTGIVGNLLYEKLPYYDDIGLVPSNDDGSFSTQLVKGQTYNLTVKKEGFKNFKREINVNGELELTYYLESDRIDLMKLENLIFASRSDKISPSSFEELNELATFLIENPGLIIQLEGHTDFAGNPDANMRLSEARVIAVKKYLADQKVKKNRIFTKAFGGTRPESRERTDKAKAQNRRVEVRFIRR